MPRKNNALKVSTKFSLPSAEFLRPECELLGMRQDPDSPQSYPHGQSLEEWMQFDLITTKPSKGQLAFLTQGSSAFSKAVDKSISDPETAKLIRHKLVRQWQYFFYHNARKGRNPTAAIQCVLDVVGFLNDFALRYNDFAKETVPHFALWPCRFSPHPSIKDNLSFLTKDSKLGSAVGLIIDQTAQWKPTDPATQIALRLITHIFSLRKTAHAKNRPSDKNYAHRAACLSFPVNTADEFKAWWIFARELLDTSYPNLKHPLFDRLVKSPSHKKTDGRRRARVYHQIQRRMRSVLGIKKIQT